jgi:hypothetical protein
MGGKSGNDLARNDKVDVQNGKKWQGGRQQRQGWAGWARYEVVKVLAARDGAVILELK